VEWTQKLKRLYLPPKVRYLYEQLRGEPNPFCLSLIRCLIESVYKVHPPTLFTPKDQAWNPIDGNKKTPDQKEFYDLVWRLRVQLRPLHMMIAPRTFMIPKQRNARRLLSNIVHQFLHRLIFRFPIQAAVSRLMSVKLTVEPLPTVSQESYFLV